MAKFMERFKHGWNAFLGRDAPVVNMYDAPPTFSYRPDKIRQSLINEKTLLNAVINRMAVDAASIRIEHVRVNSDGQYLETIDDSSMNEILNVSANIDQSGSSLRQDLFQSMLDEGCISLTPIDMDDEPEEGKGINFEIETARVCKIKQWGSGKVRLEGWNELDSRMEEFDWNKEHCFIIENPFYAIMNARNSLLRRVTRKMALLDQVDEQLSSGKLDMIIQLPFSIRNPVKRKEAAKRKQDIETQLNGSKYGIAYIDATEKITQLNRPIENNLLNQIQYLLDLFYSQLGITNEIMNGTADEKTMLNYYERIIAPMVTVCCDEFARKYLTRTARTQGQTFKYFRDPFKMVPVSELAEISDKLTRNEIATSNEIRSIIGWKPSSDPKADELRNSNIKGTETGEGEAMEDLPEDMEPEEYEDEVSPADTIIPGG